MSSSSCCQPKKRTSVSRGEKSNNWFLICFAFSAAASDRIPCRLFMKTTNEKKSLGASLELRQHPDTHHMESDESSFATRTNQLMNLQTDYFFMNEQYFLVPSLSRAFLHHPPANRSQLRSLGVGQLLLELETDLLFNLTRPIRDRCRMTHSPLSPRLSQTGHRGMVRVSNQSYENLDGCGGNDFDCSNCLRDLGI
jgi:hypothetical protein